MTEHVCSKSFLDIKKTIKQSADKNGSNLSKRILPENLIE